MVIGPSAAIHAGQRAAEALMRDSCTVVRLSGDVRIVGGREVRDETTVYEGRCKIQDVETVERVQVAAGRTWTVQAWHLHVPISAPLLRVGDVVRVAGHPHPLRVTGEMVKTYRTAQRVPVEQVAA